MLSYMEMMGSIQKSLWWNAPNIQACSTKFTSLLNACRFESHLCSFNSSNISYNT